MQNYNKEEVMKTFKELFPYITNEEVIAVPNEKDDTRSGDILTIFMRSEAKKLNTFLSTALDSAYKAGEENGFREGAESALGIDRALK